jgi:hypothetical protein
MLDISVLYAPTAACAVKTPAPYISAVSIYQLADMIASTLTNQNSSTMFDSVRTIAPIITRPLFTAATYLKQRNWEVVAQPTHHGSVLFK